MDGRVSFSPASQVFVGNGGKRVAEMVDAQAEGFSVGWNHGLALFTTLNRIQGCSRHDRGGGGPQGQRSGARELARVRGQEVGGCSQEPGGRDGSFPQGQKAVGGKTVL